MFSVKIFVVIWTEVNEWCVHGKIERVEKESVM